MTGYLERVRFLAGHFERLRGLQSAAVGLVLLTLAALQPVIDRLGSLERRLPLVLPIVFVFLGLQLLTRRLYERRFGSFVPHREPGAKATAAIRGGAIFIWLFAAALIDHRLEHDLGWSHPILTGLTGGAWGVLVSAHAPERRHYLWLAVGVIAASLFPWPKDSQFLFLQLMLGAVSLVGGVLDHLTLVRLTRRVAEEGRGEAL